MSIVGEIIHRQMTHGENNIKILESVKNLAVILRIRPYVTGNRITETYIEGKRFVTLSIVK